MARDYLHRVYYAQTAYRKTHGRYQDSLAALGPAAQIGPGRLFGPRLETTRSGFNASVEIRHANGTRERWRIADDSRIRRD
jgi:hypothetical protein